MKNIVIAREGQSDLQGRKLDIVELYAALMQESRNNRLGRVIPVHFRREDETFGSCSQDRWAGNLADIQRDMEEGLVVIRATYVANGPARHMITDAEAGDILSSVRFGFRHEDSPSTRLIVDVGLPSGNPALTIYEQPLVVLDRQTRATGRIYTRASAEKAIEKFQLKHPFVLGELGSPRERISEINLGNVSHRIEDLRIVETASGPILVGDITMVGPNHKVAMDLLGQNSPDVFFGLRAFTSGNSDSTLDIKQIITFDLIFAMKSPEREDNDET